MAHAVARFTRRPRPHVHQEPLPHANVTRHELHHTDETRKALTWHDLRATGITWTAIRGDDPLHIQHRAGHTSFSTTQGYIRQAEAVREGFGDVFPPLAVLLSDTERSKLRYQKGRRSELAARNLFTKASGEGGIRTRGRLLTCARLASGYLRPLGHLSLVRQGPELTRKIGSDKPARAARVPARRPPR